ncbi:hypothetical protein L484_004810 [Morus notabilis]|uniref:DUF7787 domain-containing protein n=1 Tax=Morus notabilis TaxID=981085 RepID=W9RYN3_9ROSA|nr:hypothetical protein L484_004810 [Morus notabilis]
MAREKAEKKELGRKTCKSRDSKAKISLEDYLRFLHSRNYSDLCVNFLNQIISMHGYKKIHKSPKIISMHGYKKIHKSPKVFFFSRFPFVSRQNNGGEYCQHSTTNTFGFGLPQKVLAEAVDKLALVNPCRSTLRERISPTASTTIDDVVEDLEALNWQECTVTFVQALNSATNGLVIYTSPEPPKRRHADRSKGPTNRRKALVPIQNGGAVKKVGLGQPRKAAKRMKPIVAVMNGS